MILFIGLRLGQSFTPQLMSPRRRLGDTSLISARRRKEMMPRRSLGVEDQRGTPTYLTKRNIERRLKSRR